MNSCGERSAGSNVGCICVGGADGSIDGAGSDNDDNIGAGDEIKCGSGDGKRDEVEGVLVEVEVIRVVMGVETVVVITGARVVVGV